MATETKYIATCDRCGEKEEVDTPDELPISWGYVEITYQSPTAEQTTETNTKPHDLCSVCKQDFWQWVRTVSRPEKGIVAR